MVEQRNIMTMRFIGYEVVNDHIEYKIGLTGPNIQASRFKTRYSTLRDIYSQLKVLVNLSSLPRFPPTKWFGNKDFELIRQRSKGLEEFFNALLQKFTLDELPPLKKFLKDYIREIPFVRDPLEQNIKEIKKQFLYLENRDGDGDKKVEIDTQQVSEKKQKYQAQIKGMKWDADDLKKKLPEGKESNLAEIYKNQKRLLENTSFMKKVLDKIKMEIDKIDLPDMSNFIRHY